MAETVKYFAYGSNLHLARLQQRTPSAKPLGVARLGGYSLAFHKRSIDGSSKCDAHYTGIASDEIIGAVYELTREDQKHLSRIEGVGKGYREALIDLPQPEWEEQALLYIAEPEYIDASLKPYAWYKAFVTHGAHHHGLPKAYVGSIAAIESIDDPDHARKHTNLQILNTAYAQHSKKACSLT